VAERKHGPAIAVFAIAVVVLVVGAAGGPGWQSAIHADVAASLRHTAAAPLYGIIANVVAALPFGEVGFRLAVLSAVLGAALLAGVVEAARVLLPRDPIAGIVAAILLAATPAFRDAAGFAGPGILAACGVVWMTRFAVTGCRIAALACAAIVAGSAPWLGAALAVMLVVRLARELAIGVAGVAGVICIVLWVGAIGSLPAVSPTTQALASIGRGAGAVVLGAGILGIGFGAVTGLAFARRLAAIAGIAAVHATLFGGDIEMLGVLAIGCAVIPSAVVRAAGSPRRHVVALAAGVPLVAAALLTGPAFGIDDPGATPARVADDLVGEAPPGPGVVIAVNAPTLHALEYAHVVAGARPDLAIIPYAGPDTDLVVADALRANRVAIADVPAFGRLDPRRAVARGRGFQLLPGLPAVIAPVVPPPRYASAIGEDLAIWIAVTRGEFEGSAGRLDAAARAAGLTQRFRAGDLAVLAATVPTRARPAFFGLLPMADVGAARLDLFGDDLAWVAGIAEPVLPADAPAARRLHAKWRQIWLGKATPADPEITAMGPAAIAATAAMLATYR
jgi:hypothetical protein